MPAKKKKTKKSGSTYISKGERANVSKATTARMKALRTPGDRLRFKLKAALRGCPVKIAKENNWRMEGFQLWGDKPKVGN